VRCPRACRFPRRSTRREPAALRLRAPRQDGENHPQRPPSRFQPTPVRLAAGRGTRPRRTVAVFQSRRGRQAGPPAAQTGRALTCGCQRSTGEGSPSVTSDISIAIACLSQARQNLHEKSAPKTGNSILPSRGPALSQEGSLPLLADPGAIGGSTTANRSGPPPTRTRGRTSRSLTPPPRNVCGAHAPEGKSVGPTHRRRCRRSLLLCTLLTGGDLDLNDLFGRPRRLLRLHRRPAPPRRLRNSPPPLRAEASLLATRPCRRSLGCSSRSPIGDLAQCRDCAIDTRSLLLKSRNVRFLRCAGVRAEDAKGLAHF
jgi:hypothetical protein